MLTPLLDLFFPQSSLTGTEGTVLTDDERSALMQSRPLILTKPQLKQLGIRHLDQLVAAMQYHDPMVQRAVRALKYKRIVRLHSDLSMLIIRALPGRYHFPVDTKPVLCPVPLHWTRLFARGFNQSTLLASDIHDTLFWPVEHLLVRTRATGFQAHRRRAERLLALKDAFRLKRSAAVPAHVILIDDLCTTGTTLDECAQALRDGGAKRIDAFVVAHG